MGVTKHRDQRTGVWILQWGGRKDRQTLYTGKRDPKAAQAILKAKERELAFQEAADLEDRIAERIIRRLDPLIEAKFQERLRDIAASKPSPVGRPLPEMPVREALQNYIAAHVAAGRSKTHIENIETQILFFLEFSKVTCVSEITTQLLNNWLVHVRQVEKLGPKSAKDKLQIVKKWLSYTANPEPLPPKAPPRRLIRFFDARSYEDIIGYSMSTGDPYDYALAALALYEPFRAGEVWFLRREDIRLEIRELEIGEWKESTKVGESRRMPIFDQALDAIRPFAIGRGRVFSKWPKSQSLGEYFQALVKKAIGRADGFRIARHSTCTWLADAGVCLPKLSEWAGTSIRKLDENYVGIVPDKAERVQITYEGMKLAPGGLPRGDAAGQR